MPKKIQGPYPKVKCSRDGLCTIPGCSSPRIGRGWCKRHYYRWYHHGDPTFTKTPNRGNGCLKMGYRYFGEKRAHHIVAEKALGRDLPPTAIVHHVNRNKDDNRPENLVICPSHTYHVLIHQRMRAQDECGNANWRKCRFCKRYDDVQNLYIKGKTICHRACNAENQRKLREERKAA